VGEYAYGSIFVAQASIIGKREVNGRFWFDDERRKRDFNPADVENFRVLSSCSAGTKIQSPCVERERYHVDGWRDGRRDREFVRVKSAFEESIEYSMRARNSAPERRE
jgi:hypothetical protein